MDVKVRLAAAEARALAACAEAAHRPVSDVARDAIHEYLANHGRAEFVDRILDAELPRYAYALHRLGQQPD